MDMVLMLWCGHVLYMELILLNKYFIYMYEISDFL